MMLLAAAYKHELGAAVITGALLVGAVALTFAGRQAGVAERPKWYAVMLGKDGRLSTSKTVALLWTAVVAYVLFLLLLNDPGDWNKALKHLAPTYLLLLSGPYAALVLA